MIAKLIKKNDDCYYCGKCRMKQPKDLKPWCFFCEANFSNFEEELIKNFKESEDNNIG